HRRAFTLPTGPLCSQRVLLMPCSKQRIIAKVGFIRASSWLRTPTSSPPTWRSGHIMFRLEANNPRHADEDEPHATPEGAAQAVEFAKPFANILFVLPSRVTRGLKEAGGKPIGEGGKLPED